MDQYTYRWVSWCQKHNLDPNIAGMSIVSSYLADQFTGQPYAEVAPYVEALLDHQRRNGHEPTRFTPAMVAVATEVDGISTFSAPPPSPAASASTAPAWEAERPAPPARTAPPRPPRPTRRKPPARKPPVAPAQPKGGTADRMEAARTAAIDALRPLLPARELRALLVEDVKLDMLGMVIHGRLITDRAVGRAIDRWIMLAGLVAGPLWREVQPGGTVGPTFVP